MAEILGSVGAATDGEEAELGDKSRQVAAAPTGAQIGEIAMAVVIGMVGLWVCWDVRDQPYFDAYGPGPSFFPLWLGGLLIVLAGMIFVHTFRRGWRQSEESFLPDSSSYLALGSTLASVLLFALFIDRLGFVLTTLPILFLFLLMQGCRHLPTLLLVSLGGSVGVGYAFGHWLGVFIPPAPHSLLQFMGL